MPSPVSPRRVVKSSRVRGVEHVDVDREVDGTAVHPVADALDDRADALRLVVVGADDLEPEGLVGLELGLVVDTAAQADVDAPAQVEQSLLGGATERRTVPHGRAVQGVPGVEVRVEVDHRDRALALRHGAQEGQRDGVVAAECDQAGPVRREGVGLALDRGHGGVDGVRRDAQVTGVDHLVHREQ